MNRRSLLKSIGAAVGASVLAVPSVSSVEAVAPVDAAKTVFPWTWRISTDGGYEFTEEYASKDEAIAALLHYDYNDTNVVIAECKEQEFDLRITGDEIIDLMLNNNEDIIGEGEFISVTPEQEKELEDAVNAAISAWDKKHGINTTAWQFAGTRNHIRATDLPSLSVGEKKETAA